MLGAVTWVTGGADRATTSGSVTVASDYVLPITATTTSACIGGASTGGIMPVAIGAISASGSSVCPDDGSGIASLAGCSATSKGVPSALVPACLAEGTGATTGGA